jgi:hypothetical protein
MRYPAGMPSWSLFPPAWNPCITSAIPIVISLNPDVAAGWWTIPPLDDHSWRRNANEDISRRDADGQRACKNVSDQSSENHKLSFRACPNKPKRTTRLFSA